MWKGQSERQVDTLRELRMQLLADDSQMQKLQAKLARAADLLSRPKDGSCERPATCTRRR